MDSGEDYDVRIAALEAKLHEADKTRKELERDILSARDDVERANTGLCELEEDGNKKKKEIAALRKTVGELENDLHDERRTVSEMTDDLQKAWADHKKLQDEYNALARARHEVETRQHETQQQLDEAREQLQKMQVELDSYGALQKAAVDAARVQAELHSEIAVLHELGNPEQRKIVVLTERNTVLENENSSLTRNNEFLKRAFKGQHGNKLTSEELTQLGTAPSPTNSSLAEELDGFDYEDDDIDYDSDSTVDLPIEMSSVATQTESLPLTTTWSATQSDTPRPTMAVSTQTDTIETKAISTVSTQTDIISGQTVTVSTRKDEVERTDEMHATACPLSKEVSADFFKDGPPMLVAFVIACCVIAMTKLVDGLKRANGDGLGHDYGYGYGYGYGHMQGGSGAYGNGRYLFNTIPVAMGLGSLEGLASLGSRLIAGVESWAGSEPVLLY
jgi:predicted  nucleic acid-binding Zn-ribbon protein